MAKKKEPSIWVSEANHVFRNYTIRACGINARQAEYLAYTKYKDKCKEFLVPDAYKTCRKFVEFYGCEGVELKLGEVTFM